MLGLSMIKGFKCKKTERLFNGEWVRSFSGFSRQADKRLRILDAAETLEALRALPSNRFEALSGGRAGQYSIRVNAQWRVCFSWDEGAIEVEIVDYH
jgi:proteic killer suppression protein